MSVIGKSVLKAIETLRTPELPKPPKSTGPIKDGTQWKDPGFFPDGFEIHPRSPGGGVLNAEGAAHLPPGARNLVNPGERD